MHNYRYYYEHLVKNLEYIINVSVDITGTEDIQKIVHMQVNRLVNAKFHLYDSLNCEKDKKELLSR